MFTVKHQKNRDPCPWPMWAVCFLKTFSILFWQPLGASNLWKPQLENTEVNYLKLKLRTSTREEEAQEHVLFSHVNTRRLYMLFGLCTVVILGVCYLAVEFYLDVCIHVNVPRHDTLGSKKTPRCHNGIAGLATGCMHINYRLTWKGKRWET